MDSVYVVCIEVLGRQQNIQTSETVSNLFFQTKITNTNEKNYLDVLIVDAEISGEFSNLNSVFQFPEQESNEYIAIPTKMHRL